MIEDRTTVDITLKNGKPYYKHKMVRLDPILSTRLQGKGEGASITIFKSKLEYFRKD